MDLKRFDSLSPEQMDALAYHDLVSAANTIAVHLRKLGELQKEAEFKLRDADIRLLLASSPEDIKAAKVSRREAKAQEKVLALEVNYRKRQASLLQSQLRSPVATL